jgi:hypothetical protein
MDTFRRPELAKQMALQLLRPSVLDAGLRSGLFISGVRRTGKTTFLQGDLIPALHAMGAIVIYVDLWQDVTFPPAVLVRDAIRRCLRDLQTPSSSLLKRLSRLKKVDIAAWGLKFSFDLDQVGETGGATLAQALTEVVDQVATDVVLVVDEVQQAINTEDGKKTLFGLKAARDAINSRPGTPGFLIFIGTGSHRAMVHELSARNNQAFSGATSIPFPLLGEKYVAWLLDRLAQQGMKPLPGLPAAHEAFSILGHKPEELLRALRTLRNSGTTESPDKALYLIACALRTAAADVEIQKITEMGVLAQAIFDRIARTGKNTSGIYSAEAITAYSTRTGRPVRVEEIQPVVNQLLEANLIIRHGYGNYAVTDPTVQECWLEAAWQ